MEITILPSVAAPGLNSNVAKVAAVTRKVPYTEGVGRAALDVLLYGPTAEDGLANLVTFIPMGVKLQSLKIENGVARADFNATLSQVTGNCYARAVRAQIEETLKQFGTVKSVEISVDGETGGVLAL